MYCMLNENGGHKSYVWVSNHQQRLLLKAVNQWLPTDYWTTMFILRRLLYTCQLSHRLIWGSWVFFMLSILVWISLQRFIRRRWTMKKIANQLLKKQIGWQIITRTFFHFKFYLLNYHSCITFKKNTHSYTIIIRTCIM